MQSENHGADTRLGVSELTDIEPVIGQLKKFVRINKHHCTGLVDVRDLNRFSRKNYYSEGGLGNPLV